MNQLNLHSINPDSGQITVPKEIRDEFDSNTFHVFVDRGTNCIVLKSVRVKREGEGYPDTGDDSDE